MLSEYKEASEVTFQMPDKVRRVRPEAGSTEASTIKTATTTYSYVALGFTWEENRLYLNSLTVVAKTKRETAVNQF